MLKNEKENIVQVIIETPKGSAQKFDYDPNQSLFILNKVLPAGMVFPFDFGFIPGTIGEDGDPLDVLVISEYPTFTGCAMACRIIGAITANQEELNGDKMRNDRFLAIPEISLRYADVTTVRDLSAELRSQIESFFINYNAQAGKTFTPLSFILPTQAMKLIETGKRNNETKEILIELFIPLNASEKQEKYLMELENELTEKFGGISIYTREPVKGKWHSEGKTEQDELLVLEVMCQTLDQSYWKKLKSKLEKQFKQEELLIRSSKISLLN